MPEPFMEHPSGQFGDAVEAMADAITRLRALADWNDWITFGAQGMGGHIDSYLMGDIRMLHDKIKVETDKPIDIGAVVAKAGVSPSCFAEHGDFYSLASSTPKEASRVMDAIFRHHMGIRPHTGEGNDYAVGVEWEHCQ